MPSYKVFFKILKESYGFLKDKTSVSTIAIHNISPLFWLLVGIFTLVFLPQAFIMLESTTLLSSLEVDPASLMQSTADLFKWPFYNMHNSYHSKFYGWTYLSINFFILIPVKIFIELTNVGNPELFHLTMRLILFVISLTGIICFYYFVVKFLKSNLLAFFSSIFLIFSNTSTVFYVFIHPETTGVLFLILSLICLLKFKDNIAEQKYWYILGLSALILASLSKQIFFIISLPILFLFVFFYLRNNQLTALRFFRTRDFYIYLAFTSALAFLILFIIHPYGILQPDKFVKAQFSTLNDHTHSSGALSFVKAFLIWWKVIFTNAPLFLITVITAPFALIIAIRSKKIKFENKVLFCTNLISIMIILLLISSFARLFAGNLGYLYPLYPFVIINILLITKFCLAIESKLLKKLFYLTLASVGILVCVNNFIYSYKYLYSRLQYKASSSYLAYDYIQSNVSPGSKIVHDHFVAVPSSGNILACHYWRECNSYENIVKFSPDFVIFNNDFKMNNKDYENTVNLQRYVVNNDFEKIKIFTGQSFAFNLNDELINITIFKRRSK